MTRSYESANPGRCAAARRLSLVGLLLMVGTTLACAAAHRPSLMPDGSLASRGRLGQPWGIAATADAVYFSEESPTGDATVIRRVRLDDGRISTVATGAARRSDVVGVFGSGGLVVDEYPSGPVRIDVATGERHRLMPSGDRWNAFQAVATDGSEVVLLNRRGTIWWLDAKGGSPRHIAGRELTGSGDSVIDGDGGPAVDAALGAVEDAAVDANGHVYVSTSGERADGLRIRRIDSVTGIITTVVGPATVVEGDEAGAPRVRPGPMAVAPDGTLVFSDAGQRILRYDPLTSAVTLVAGGQRGRGATSAVRFERIWDLAALPDRGLLVFDYGANRIHHIDTAGGVRTIVGNDGRLYGHSRLSIVWITEPPPDNERCSNGLEGPIVTVVTSDSVGPVEGVRVRLYRIQDFSRTATHEPVPVAAGTAQAGGRVPLQAPAGGSYLVIAAFPGFSPVSKRVTLSSGCEGELPLLIQPIGTTRN